MKKHIQIYHKTLGLDFCDYRPSELSNAPGVDLHHIECKGMGGNPSGDKDRIENIIALTREEHIKYGDKKHFMSFLFKAHMRYLEKRKIPFDKEYILQKIKAYEAVCENTY
ncbi:hypothetical protein BTO06_09855 [Tenacibaculum sp. SZ-18]|uniref:hypothetical protein n=1 Tax=Tenacibaculum sp. SZ-18 TaxID=754423 RepID=UPI000C2D65D2|nr:hypothetical protein [Tenacibaculum sp. SZ-18]AUC15424.1 hypothetical protein BTO06_09855 [Tenacibaculum sp. SZ-18]